MSMISFGIGHADIGRDIDFLRQVSMKSGVPIVKPDRVLIRHLGNLLDANVYVQRTEFLDSREQVMSACPLTFR